MSIRIGRIGLAFLVLALITGSVALPASAHHGGAVVAKKSKCKKKKKKKAKRAAAAKKKKKKKCKRGGGGGASAGLPGQATHPTPTQPNQPTEPTQPPPAAALKMSSVTVADNPVLAKHSTSGQVTISGKAPAGGQSVALQSSVPSRVTVPSSVVVAAEQKTATFPVGTTLGGPVTATLTGSIGSSAKNTQLSVVDTPSVSSVSLERQCFTGPGSFASNRVTLDVPAPSDTTVGLSSDNTSSLDVPATGTVTVPSGSKSALFGVTAGSLADPLVTVTATLFPSTATDTASVSLTDPTPAASDLTLNPDTVAIGETPTGTVTLDCEALSGGTEVTLESGDTNVATVPPSVTVSQDELSAAFDIDAVGGGTATITATGPSGDPQQATLTVTNLAD